MTPVDLAKAALREVLALPVAKEKLQALDRGIGTKTPTAAWLRAREALTLLEAEGADGWRPTEDQVANALFEGLNAQAGDDAVANFGELPAELQVILRNAAKTVCTLSPPPVLVDEEGEG